MRIPASGFVQIRLKVQKAPGKARTLIPLEKLNTAVI